MEEIKIDNQQNNDKKLNIIKYKTNILSNKPSLSKTKSIEDINDFLEQTKISKQGEPWSKLDKTTKLKRLEVFALKYKISESLTDLEYEHLIIFFKDCLERGKLQRVKDVICDKETGEIKSVPALQFNKSTNNYTLKNIDKRVSTTKSLAPKKTINGTIKNIVQQDSDSEND